MRMGLYGKRWEMGRATVVWCNGVWGHGGTRGVFAPRVGVGVRRAYGGRSCIVVWGGVRGGGQGEGDRRGAECGGAVGAGAIAGVTTV